MQVIYRYKYIKAVVFCFMCFVLSEIIETYSRYKTHKVNTTTVAIYANTSQSMILPVLDVSYVFSLKW